MSDYFHYQYVERDDDGNLRPLPASPYLLPAAILGGCLWGLGKLLDWVNKPEPLKLDELQLVESKTLNACLQCVQSLLHHKTRFLKC